MKRNFKVKTTKKHTKPALVALIKKTINKSAETKSYIADFTATQSSDTCRAFNLNYAMSPGSGEGQYVGEKIHVKNINMKIVVSQLATAAQNEAMHYRILLIRTKQQLTTTSTTISSSDVFRNSTVGLATIGHVDLNKVTLLYDKLVHIPAPNISGVNCQKSISFNKTINKNEIWDQSNSGYFKNSNYYLLAIPQNPSNSISIGFVRFQYTINFKDL